MEITLVGIIDLILSIYAFVKKNDNLLIKIALFFSVFTAAIALNITITTTPISLVEIPIILWILRQFIGCFKRRKEININDITNKFKSNKLAILFATFIVIMAVSEIYACLSGFNITFFDNQYLETRVLKFGMANINQFCRLVLLLFAVLLFTLKKYSKADMRSFIKAFRYGCAFGVVFGLIQYALFVLNLDYPAWLFNNNQYGYQGYDQYVGSLRRVSSIGIEPSVFGFTLLAYIPLLVSYFLDEKERNGISKKVLIFIILTLICGFLTTSSTFYLGISILITTRLIEIWANKKIEIKKKLKHIFKVMVVVVISGCISLGLLYVGSFITEREYYKDISSQLDDTDEEYSYMSRLELKKKSASSMVYTFAQLTVKKLSSGSGEARTNQEKTALMFYTKSPIFGLGHGSIRTFNIYTNILVGIGALGLITFIGLIVVSINTTMKNRNIDNTFSKGILYSIMGMLIGFTGVPDLMYLFFWVILAIGFKYFQNEEKEFGKSNNNEGDKKMKIGIDARGLDGKRTGITTYIEQIILGINKLENDENEYILYSNRDINIDEKLKKNIQIKVCRAKKGTIWAYLQLPKILHQDNVDVFWGTQHLLPIRNEYTKSIKYVLTIHDIANLKLKNIGQLKNAIIQKLFVGRSCKIADKIIADSKSTKDDLVEILKIKAEKIDVVYLGTNFSSNYNVSKENENEIFKKFNIEKENYIFFVSTIEPRKNIVTLVKAFNELKTKKENEKLKLVLAGGLGWKYEPILEEIKNSEYSEDIIMPGYISNEEKQCLLRNCKCFAYPSLYEGFGLPILEAFVNRALVVTSNISSIPEVGGNAAIYYDNVLDHNELAQKLENAIKMEAEEKNKRIEEGIKLANEFTWEKCTRETINILINQM